MYQITIILLIASLMSLLALAAYQEVRSQRKVRIGVARAREKRRSLLRAIDTAARDGASMSAAAAQALEDARDRLVLCDRQLAEVHSIRQADWASRTAAEGLAYVDAANVALDIGSPPGRWS